MNNISKSASGDLDLRKKQEELETTTEKIRDMLEKMTSYDMSFQPFSSVGENVEITEKYRVKCGNVVQISAVMGFKNDIAEYQTLATLAIPPKTLVEFTTTRPSGIPMFVFANDGRIQSRNVLNGGGSIRFSFMYIS